MADGTPALGGDTFAGESQRVRSNEACSSEPGTFGVGKGSQRVGSNEACSSELGPFGVGEEGLVSGFGIERNLSFGKERSLKGLVWYPKGVTPQRVKGDTLFLGQSCSAAEIPRTCAFRVSPNFLASSVDAQTSSNPSGACTLESRDSGVALNSISVSEFPPRLEKKGKNKMCSFQTSEMHDGFDLMEQGRSEESSRAHEEHPTALSKEDVRITGGNLWNSPPDSLSSIVSLANPESRIRTRSFVSEEQGRSNNQDDFPARAHLASCEVGGEEIKTKPSPTCTITGSAGQTGSFVECEKLGSLDSAVPSLNAVSPFCNVPPETGVGQFRVEESGSQGSQPDSGLSAKAIEVSDASSSMKVEESGSEGSQPVSGLSAKVTEVSDASASIQVEGSGSQGSQLESGLSAKVTEVSDASSSSKVEELGCKGSQSSNVLIKAAEPFDQITSMRVPDGGTGEFDSLLSNSFREPGVSAQAKGLPSPQTVFSMEESRVKTS